MGKEQLHMDTMGKLLKPGTDAAPDAWPEPTGDTAIDTRLRDVLQLAPWQHEVYSPEKEYEVLRQLAPQLRMAPPESADPEHLLQWKAQMSPSRESSWLNETINKWRNIQQVGPRRGRTV